MFRSRCRSVKRYVVRRRRYPFHRCLSSSPSTQPEHYGRWHTPAVASSSSALLDDAWRSRLPAWLFKEAIVAKPGFNRWLVPPAAVATHLCIGSVYAWSLFNEPLTRELGVVVSAANDWTLAAVVPVFSTAIVFLGGSAAFAGKWLEDVGPRLVGSVSAIAWGGGFLVGAAGLYLHSLPLVYLGYGVLGGIGLGLGYVSPVSTLLRWFPDRRGMATGMAIMGFGGGAMIAAPVKDRLLRHFFTAPDYLGAAEDVELKLEGGRRFAESASGELIEVVVANAADLAATGIAGLREGVYVVGTGGTGATETFCVLGGVYGATILAAALCYRVPSLGWAPDGWSPPPTADSSTADSSTDHGDTRRLLGDREEGSLFSAGITRSNVDIDEALKTPQFYQLWFQLFANVSAGIGVIALSKTMVTDIFGTAMPTVVDGAFAASYVGAIGVANMAGRFAWATGSDVIGRKNTYHAYFACGIPLYLSVPIAAEWAGTSPGTAPLAMFCTSTMLIFSMYGGGFSTIPAYIADMFGDKHVGGIHGRLLTAWSSAGVFGPLLVTQLREKSTTDAIKSLTANVSETDFLMTFGAGKDSLDVLVDSSSVTISQLMAISPPGTLDPTGGLYTSTFHTMAGVLAVAMVSNALMRPVHPKHFDAIDDRK